MYVYLIEPNHFNSSIIDKGELIDFKGFSNLLAMRGYHHVGIKVSVRQQKIKVKE